MRITDIHIDRFGVWRNLSLPLTSSGLNVFYGPNEAGKTTLLRFIRGVLYGFEPLAAFPHRKQVAPQVYEGRLSVDHLEQACEIHRTSHGNSHALLSVNGLDRDLPAEELLSEMLGGLTKDVFDRVFAIGLPELQELATLDHQEVAQQIYNISLGHEAHALLEATGRIDAAAKRLSNPAAGSGALVELFRRHQQLSEQLDSLEGRRSRHAELCRERARLENDVDQWKASQSEIHASLRGHQFLDRVWTPWKKVRDCQTELNRLPTIVGFPDGGPARLEELESDLAAALKCRDDLLHEAARFRKAADELQVDAELTKHVASLQSFVDQRDWVLELGREIKQAEVRANECKEKLAEKLPRLGPQWTLEKLAQVDTSPTAHFELVGTARRYQTSLSRRRKLRRRIKALSAITARRAAELKTATKELGDATPDEAIRLTQRRIDELHDVGRLKLRLCELEQRRIGIHDQLQRLRLRVGLPVWAYSVLTFLGLSGMIYFVMGLVTGTTISGLGGLAYAVAGTTSLLLAMALKRLFEGEVRSQLADLEDQARENEVRLRETQLAVRRIMAAGSKLAANCDSGILPLSLVVASRPDEDSAEAPPAAADVSEADALRQAAQTLARLEQMAQNQQHVQRTRRKLTALRGRYQVVARDVAAARQQWCELLVQLGLAETVRVKEAFDVWQAVVDASEQRRQWEAARDELHERQRMLHSFRQRMEEFGRRAQCWDVDYSRPLDVLHTWEAALKEIGQKRVERRRLRREERIRRREAAEYRQRIDELKMQRSALLVQGGAATPEEFEQRARAVALRRELLQQLQSAQSELEEAARTEPELAIVEEDLLAYVPEQNRERIEQLYQEAEDVDAELGLTFEQLGRVKQEIEALESDRRATSLRFDRELVVGEILRTAEQWCGVQLAEQVIDEIRQQFERTCQPPILAGASQFLRQLTRGRYRKVWTPLGRRRLCIDDEHNESLVVEQLSGGTREQLFLAIRMAMLRDLAGRGIELPLVLDDILVNFDQARTEAAADTLLEFAQQGQQILLFTCHLHLAHLFESKGLNPIWLPGHTQALEERRAG